METKLRVVMADADTGEILMNKERYLNIVQQSTSGQYLHNVIDSFLRGLKSSRKLVLHIDTFDFVTEHSIDFDSVPF